MHVGFIVVLFRLAAQFCENALRFKSMFLFA